MIRGLNKMVIVEVWATGRCADYSFWQKSLTATLWQQPGFLNWD